MLPYSPLHHLLLADCRRAARADERQRLRRADRVPRRGRARAARRDRRPASSVHDRPIQTRTDDSVVRTVASATRAGRCCCAARAATCRRRCALPVRRRRPLLACGAELKNTFCVAKGERAWVGHHIGDLENYETLRSFTDGHRALRAPVRGRAGASSRTICTPSTCRPSTRSSARASSSSACSTTTRTWPPAWPSTASAGRPWARSSTAPGYGTDGTVWGGELLFGDLAGFERDGHAVAGAHARRRGGDPPALADGVRVARRRPARARCRGARGRVAGARGTRSARSPAPGVASPLTTSVGRLFDAVAALCGSAPRSPTRARRRSSSRPRATRPSTGAYPLPLVQRRDGSLLDARADGARGRRRPRRGACRRPRSPRASTTPSPPPPPRACAVLARRGATLDRRALRRRVPEPPAARAHRGGARQRAGCACSRPSGCRRATAASPTARRRWRPRRLAPGTRR